MAAREYVVLSEEGDGTYIRLEGTIEATSAGNACIRAATAMTTGKVDEGVTLVAIPARNWNGGRHVLKAETQRRIRSA